jgi:hypothetical protein
MIADFISNFICNKQQRHTNYQDYLYATRQSEESRLTISQQLYNLQNKLRKNYIQIKYQSDLAFNEYIKQIEQYHFIKDKVNAMSPEQKLQYIPLWVKYLCEYHTSTNPFTKEHQPMCLDIFIATQIIPFKFYGTIIAFKPSHGYIKYV